MILLILKIIIFLSFGEEIITGLKLFGCIVALVFLKFLAVFGPIILFGYLFTYGRF